jgi:hypothetical protein
MRRTVHYIALFALAGAAGAQGPTTTPAYDAEFDALNAAFEQAHDAFFDELRAKYAERAKAEEAKAEERRRRAESRPEGTPEEPSEAVAAVSMVPPDMTGDPTHAYAPKFADLAARARGTGAAVRALTWLVAHAAVPGPALTGAAAPSADAARARTAEARRALMEDYLESPHLLGFCEHLQQGFGPALAANEADLRKIAAKSPHREVKAAATASLALLLAEDDGQDYVEVDGAWKAVQRYTPEVLARRNAESRELLLAVKKNFGDTGAFARVEGPLFEAEHLQVGMVAPDFEAVDADGKSFKLSDYRGKVVALDFWGYW